MNSNVESPLRVAAFQFRGSGDAEANCSAILRGLESAAAQGARMVATQECALSGYAGVDIPNAWQSDPRALQDGVRQIAVAAVRLNLYVSLGCVMFARGKTYNALRLIGPDGRTRLLYYKRAMYGDDVANYSVGARDGAAEIDGVRTGLRICYEFRFPEYFREMLLAQADLVVMGFSMVGTDDAKFETAKAHLCSRAAENGLWILAANNTNGVQNAPTCLVNPEGRITAEAPRGEEALIVGDVQPGARTPLCEAIRAHGRSLAESNGAG
jgi:omega-amidase